MLRTRRLKPKKGRRKDLRQIDTLISDLQPFVQREDLTASQAPYDFVIFGGKSHAVCLFLNPGRSRPRRPLRASRFRRSVRRWWTKSLARGRPASGLVCGYLRSRRFTSAAPKPGASSLSSWTRAWRCSAAISAVSTARGKGLVRIRSGLSFEPGEKFADLMEFAGVLLLVSGRSSSGFFPIGPIGCSVTEKVESHQPRCARSHAFIQTPDGWF